MENEEAGCGRAHEADTAALKAAGTAEAERACDRGRSAMGEAPPREASRHDLVVIGAGPHALTLVLRLLELEPDMLTEGKRASLSMDEAAINTQLGSWPYIKGRATAVMKVRDIPALTFTILAPVRRLCRGMPR